MKPGDIMWLPALQMDPPALFKVLVLEAEAEGPSWDGCAYVKTTLGVMPRNLLRGHEGMARHELEGQLQAAVHHAEMELRKAKRRAEGIVTVDATKPEERRS